MLLVAVRALASDGNKIAINKEMIEMTTRSSMSVKAFERYDCFRVMNRLQLVSGDELFVSMQNHRMCKTGNQPLINKILDAHHSKVENAFNHILHKQIQTHDVMSENNLSSQLTLFISMQKYLYGNPTEFNQAF